MRKRSSIVWKLNLVIIAIIVVVIVADNVISKIGYERDATATARAMSQFHLEAMLLSLERLMIARDNEGIREVIAAAADHDPLCQNIRLVSHEGSLVTSARPGTHVIDPESWPCTACHAFDDPRRGLTVDSHDRVIQLSAEERGVSVLTPVLNAPRCSSAECHASPDEDPVLGLLQAEFSLREVDALAARRNLAAVLAVVIAAALTIGGTWFTMDRLLGRRMHALTAGMGKVAEGDLTVRFGDFGNDEVGELAASFDYMTGALQSTLRELRSTSDYLWGIVENSADIIITVDRGGLIETFNSGAEHSLGYRRDEVIGREIEMLFADPSERSYAIAKLENTDNVSNYETHFLTKDGEVRDVILTLSRLRSRTGESIGTFGISKDVTRENRMRRELILNEKLAAIGQAVTGIQHSIKNMLSSLKGGAYMVDTGLQEDDRALLEEGWTMVQEGIDNITQLSSRMLHYVRGWQPQLERTDIRNLLGSVCSATRDMAEDKGVKLVCEIAPGLPNINCDPRLIRLAILDLVANAIDACAWKDYQEPERPRVDLRAESADPSASIEIEVEDNGEGMSREIRKNLFTPFFSTKKRLGTGVGLALTARIIRRHDGTINVESERNVGTVFKVVLPVAGPAERKVEHDG